MALRTLISRSSSSLISLYPFISARSFASNCISLPFVARAAPLLRLRPLVSAVGVGWTPAELVRNGSAVRCFSTRPTTSSLNDPSPNWSNRPPKETILLDGCDFEHWLVVMEPPEGEPTRDDIIDSYIKTLAQVVGSEDEARMKIYSVSTRHYFAFGALVSEELSYKIKALPKVRWVLPDSYLDVKNKDYGGEPFIDGKAVPYDPKYHEEWVRNNARANERSRRNDRPRNFDRSRNFERRRENMQNRDFQNRVPSPMPNQQFQSSEGQNPMPPRDMPPGPGARNTVPPVPPPGNMPPNSGGIPGSMPQNVQYPNRDSGAFSNPSFQGTPNRGYQNQGPGYQGSYAPNRDGHMPGTNAYQGAASGNVHQGGGGPYQGGGGIAPQGAGNAYQGGGGIAPQGAGNAYQGGGGGSAPQGAGNAYQGGGGGSAPQGAGNAYQGGSGSAPQGAGNAYQGGGGSYQGSGSGYQGGSGGGYPGGGNVYQGGGGPVQGGGNGYQGGVGGGYPGGGNAYQGDGGGGGGGSFQSGGNPHQGRDMPGRD